MDIITFFPALVFPVTLFLFFPSIFISTIRRNCSPLGAFKLPPCPPRLPVIGNLHQLLSKQSIHQTLWNLSQTYGPIMLFHFGSQPFLVVSSSEMAGEVLQTHDLKMCSRSFSMASKRLSYNFMDVAFSPHGAHWRDMRRVLVSEFLGAKRCRLFKNMMENEMEALVHSLSLLSLSRTTINLDDMLLSLVHGVVCKVAIGSNYSEKTFNGRKLKEIVHETHAMLRCASFSDIFPAFGWMLDKLGGWDRRLERCFSDLDGFLQMILDDHLDGHETKTNHREKDFVDDCISRLTCDEMKAILVNVLMGAIDTTVTTMVWAMSEIIKNPGVMQKLQNEIRSCVGNRSRVDESDINKMTYLKMVVKETLRLHAPAAFLLGRECVSHCQIGGYDVLPGMKVMVSSWGLGRDSRTWKEYSNEFRPERFEYVEIDFGGYHFEMIPFGGGRRACPGYNLGITNIEFMIANLLYFFNWETPNGVKNEDLDMKEHGYPIIHRKTPLCLVPINYN